MKVSKYNFYYYNRLNENKVIVFNSRTGALSTMDQDHYKQLEKLNEDNEEIKDTDFIQNLTSCGYIVEDNIDELKLIRHELNRCRYNSSVLGLTIAPTMNCNFRCIYCFEKDSIRNIRMSDSVADNVISYIEDRAKSISRLHISWFGGEPLLELDRIYDMSNRITNICKTYDIEYTATVITNGYFLTKNTVTKLLDSGIKNVQITLDGPEDIHDSRRPLANGKGTFSKIIENLKNVADIIAISVRINTDIENVDRISEVIEVFKKENIFNKLRIYLGLVESSNDNYAEKKCLSVEQYSKTNLEFMIDNNINMLNIYPTPRGNFCTADKINDFVIGPEGDIYKCWCDIGIKERSISNIMNQESNDNLALYMDYMSYDPTLDEKCTECKYLPLCMGGCPHRRISDFEVCSEQKYILDEYISECTKVILSKVG